jgi:hypothetical protein
MPTSPTSLVSMIANPTRLSNGMGLIMAGAPNRIVLLDVDAGFDLFSHSILTGVSIRCGVG